MTKVLAIVCALVALAALGYIVWLVFPKGSAGKPDSKLARASRLGLASWVLAVSVTTAVDLWAATSPSDSGYPGTLLLSLLCLSPMGVVGFAGGYALLSFMEYVRKRLTSRGRGEAKAQKA